MYSTLFIEITQWNYFDHLLLPTKCSVKVIQFSVLFLTKYIAVTAHFRKKTQTRRERIPEPQLLEAASGGYVERGVGK
jgi:hypothetical protein